MKWIDRNGMGLRLYLIFMGFTVTIVGIVFFIQLFNINDKVREETLSSLKNITWNISSTYGTEAYYKAMRAAAYSSGYLIKTVTEDGRELDSIEGVDVDGRWPPIVMNRDTLVERLNESPGYIDYVVKGQKSEWVVHAQVMASWDGMREIIFVAKSIDKEKKIIHSIIIYLLESAVIILVISIFLAWIFTRRFLKPIQDITNNTREVAKGNYSVVYNETSYTELRILSETLNRAVREFADYEEIRRSLIANVSHDMRTPLTLIKAYAEMVLNLSGDNKRKREEHLKVIIDQSDKLSDFVNSSLQLARLQSGGKDMSISLFCLDDLVVEVVRSFEVIYNERVDFIMNIVSPVSIKGDRGMIEQVIYNLISNAIKYSDKSIKINVVKRKRNRVMFEVIDQGEGIPSDVLSNVWTKYYKVKPYVKNNSNTGVGLSIVKEILELHNFEYGVESTVGEGSRFWFEAGSFKRGLDKERCV